MYILMLSRGVPTKAHPQWGCFEKDQAEALARLGHKVVVMSVDARLTKSRGKLGLTRFTKNGVTYYNKVILPAEFFIKVIGREKYWKNIRFKIYSSLLKKIIKEEGKPDVIYSQFFYNTAFAVSIKDAIKVPVVGIEHLARFNEPKLSAFDEKWASYAFKGADKMIAVAGTLAQNLKKRFEIECSVVHNTYGNEFEYKGEFPKYNPDAPLHFVTVGSLVKRKGFDCLIDAFSVANLPEDKWRLEIIGGGEEYDNLKEQIRINRLEKNISLLGEMDKNGIVERLKDSHVFVLPSRNENFSVAILEGLAMGLPVLATDCGGIRECIDEKNGIIVPVDDWYKMGEAIKHFIDNYPTYDRDYIREDTKKRFSAETIAGELVKVFEDAINN